MESAGRQPSRRPSQSASALVQLRSNLNVVSCLCCSSSAAFSTSVLSVAFIILLLPAPSAERLNNSLSWFVTRCAAPNNRNGVEKQKSLFEASKRQ
ncbi:unnamed protein product [Lepidochelys olivacea]